MDVAEFNSIGGSVDRLYSLRAQRLALEEEEKALQEHIKAKLAQENLDSVAGRVARVSLVRKTLPTIVDWGAVTGYVKGTGDFSVLQKRLTTRLVTEMMEMGEKLPGVETIETVTLSVTKR